MLFCIILGEVVNENDAANEKEFSKWIKKTGNNIHTSLVIVVHTLFPVGF